ncbi:hypothetical protein [Peribacillus sp. NPDC097295]|uniref:hypothetical protein n=1 Tax=Peribacillus sp. NPDC097295 TaxID=3364402 RepID=UPI0037FAB457
MKDRKLIFIFIPLLSVIGLYLFIDIEKDYSKLSMVELHKLAQKEDVEAQGILLTIFKKNKCRG